MTNPLLFVFAVVGILATPGPTNTLLATAGAAYGMRWAIPLLVAELLGYLTAIGIISALVALFPIDAHGMSAVFRACVAIYLVLVATGLWRFERSAVSQRSPIRFQNVFLTTLLNPKAVIFALAVIPWSSANWLASMTIFAFLVVMIGFCWIAVGLLIVHPRSDMTLSTVFRVASIVILGFATTLLVFPLLEKYGG